MAKKKTNYSYEKRQKELAKKAKKEVKKNRKLEPNSPVTDQETLEQD